MEGLEEKIAVLAGHIEKGRLWGRDGSRVMRLVERFEWSNAATVLDEAAEKVVRGASAKDLG